LFLEENNRQYARIISYSDLVVHVYLFNVDTDVSVRLDIEEQRLKDPLSLLLQQKAMEEPCALSRSALGIERFLRAQVCIVGVIH
jgi:hypothetical protein